MKMKIRKFSMTLAVAFAVVLASCSSDDNVVDPGGDAVAPTCTDGIQNGDETGVDCGGTCTACEVESSEDTVLTGTLTEDRTLDASETYTLDNSFSVESGATLTIPAGTTINANVQTGDETSTYIVVQKGGKIDIQGSAAAPVIMQSTGGNSGDWGGLVILGDATTTEGTDATAEVGGFKYGGSNDADDSGSISYLIIKHAGAQIDAESQYNGLTLYAVGSTTTIDNVAMIDGEDDGVEFFGGTVSASNLYFENNQDDSIDWTEGWNGTVTDAYILHTAEGFSTALEGDKANGNPKFINLTAISSVDGTALQFKATSGATITNLYLEGYETLIDMKDAGPLTNVQIDGADATVEGPYNTGTKVDIAKFDWVGSETEAEPQSITLTGVVSGDMTLDANNIYVLNNSLSVEAGSKLIIPAGTKITATVETGDETSTYIVVQKGAQIEINGTESAPVVLESSGGNSGDWGGLVILGDATTTEGTDATAEVGGFKYGGSNDTDDSGSISYLIIKHAGAQIDAESQYNGLTLYAVGSETTIENIALIDGEDDGVEFFGGTVSASNLYFENNQDDSIDWTEGWNGTVTNAYISHTAEGFSTALEGDKANGNPMFVNLTAISSVDGTALQFKATSGATITNLYLEGYETLIDMKDAGPLANVQIDDADATVEGPYNSGTKVDVTMFGWATGN